MRSALVPGSGSTGSVAALQPSRRCRSLFSPRKRRERNEDTQERLQPKNTPFRRRHRREDRDRCGMSAPGCRIRGALPVGLRQPGHPLQVAMARASGLEPMGGSAMTLPRSGGRVLPDATDRILAARAERARVLAAMLRLLLTCLLRLAVACGHAVVTRQTGRATPAASPWKPRSGR